MPVLVEFMQRYPQIELDIELTDRIVDVVEEGFDAVIRTGSPGDSRLVARSLGQFRLVLVGTPGYFREWGVPQAPRTWLTTGACGIPSITPANSSIGRCDERSMPRSRCCRRVLSVPLSKRWTTPCAVGWGSPACPISWCVRRLHGASCSRCSMSIWNTAAPSGCSGLRAGTPPPSCGCSSIICARDFFRQTVVSNLVLIFKTLIRAPCGLELLHNTPRTVFLRIFDA